MKSSDGTTLTIPVSQLWKSPAEGFSFLNVLAQETSVKLPETLLSITVDDTHGPVARSPGNRCGCGVRPNSCPGEPVRPC